MSTTAAFPLFVKNVPFDKDVLRNSISSFSDLSDAITNHIHIKFKNGYSLGVIQGEYTYGGPEGLFEIGLFDQSGSLDGSLLDEDDQGDDVLGHCTLDTVAHYAKKLALIPSRG